jgi:dienelactone hydrolase
MGQPVHNPEGTMIQGRTPRHWRARLAAVTLAASLVGAGATFAPAVAAPAAPAKAPRPKVAPIGKYAVGVQTRTFVDSARPTDANGSAPALPTRTLKTTIYYPAASPPTEAPTENSPPDTKHGRYPLVLFSHGIYATGAVYLDVLKTWASAGYVIAAPNYPLSSADALGGVNFGSGVADTKNQPADATFVINQVIKDKQVGGLVDTKRIGASGHSLGGITTYGLAYSACCRDKRIKAALPMSGFAGVVEDSEKYVWDDRAPLLALHGDADGTVSYVSDTNTFAWAKPPKFLLTFPGAGHIFPFLGGDTEQATALKQSTVDFLDRYLKDDKSALDRLRAHANVPGTATLNEQPGATGANAATTKRGAKGE